MNCRPVFYIQYFTQILKILRCVCFKCSKLKISKQKFKHLLDLEPKAHGNKFSWKQKKCVVVVMKLKMDVVVNNQIQLKRIWLLL